jgi:uncharacterized membrane protein
MASDTRIRSLDALRGLIMIIMALDHVRDFIHAGAMTFSPTDLTRTTAALFFTRWITHFCAPVFFFAAGAAAFLWRQRGRSNAQLSRFLVTRGLWLIILEVTVMRLSYQFNFSTHEPVFLVVLWALGASMILLGGLIWLPPRPLAILSVATIVLHNLLDGVRGGAVWNILHQVGAFRLGGATVIVAYPLVPWVAVMAAGYCFGPVLLLEESRRRRIMFTAGAAMIAVFVALRAINGYGDPVPWTSGPLSFLNTSKYPPSLDFLLMTLGPALLALAWLDGFRWGDTNPLIVFGRVPLFYFIVHFYLAHAISAVLAWIRYGSAAFGFVFHLVPSMGGPRELYPKPFGYGLWVAYVVWALMVVSLYPLCRWFARVKAWRRSGWLSYL